MAFELFDQIQAIRIHNQLHQGSKLLSTENFGLEAFSEDFQKRLEQGFILYRQAHYVHKGFEGKRVSGYQRVLSLSPDLSSVRKFLAERIDDEQAANSFIAREEISQDTGANEGFGHYTHKALLQAYEYLRTIEKKWTEAAQEVEDAHQFQSNPLVRFFITA